MTQQQIFKFMNEMLITNTSPRNNEFWVSTDIYSQLNTNKYLHYNIYTSDLIPEDTMYLGKMYL